MGLRLPAGHSGAVPNLTRVEQSVRGGLICGSKGRGGWASREQKGNAPACPGIPERDIAEYGIVFTTGSRFAKALAVEVPS